MRSVLWIGFWLNWWSHFNPTPFDNMYSNPIFWIGLLTTGCFDAFHFFAKLDKLRRKGYL